MSLKDDPHYAQLHAAGWHTRGYLPHFDGEQLPQFVTIHLADSIPQKVMKRWQEELQYMKDKPRKVWLQKRINKYLDHGYGECFLRDRRVATKVQNSLLHFENTRYKLFAWVVMPNHVHYSDAPRMMGWRQFFIRSNHLPRTKRTRSLSEPEHFGFPSTTTAMLETRSISSAPFATLRITL